MNQKIIVTGNYSDSTFALDIAEHIGIHFDISDLVSLKVYANGEFCPRFIPNELENHTIGYALEGYTVIICSSSNNEIGRNELAMRNLILARAAKDNGAQRVILIEPDLFYSAQDRGPRILGMLEKERSQKDLQKFNGQAFTSLLYAQLLKASGVDSVITIHNHSRNVQSFFSEIFNDDFHNLIPADLYAHYINNSDFVKTGDRGDSLVLCAPDQGARGMIDFVWNSLSLPSCKRLVMDKIRSDERHVEITEAMNSEIGINDIEGKDVIIMDDMVRTGATIIECCRRLRSASPRRLCFCVSHFCPSQELRENLNNKDLNEILTTSTIPNVLHRDSQGRLRRKMAVLKIGKWISRYVLTMLGMDASAFKNDFYSVDMSSKNPRFKGR